MAEHRGIRGRIVLLVAVGALAPLGALGFVARSRVDRLEEQLSEERQMLVRTLAAYGKLYRFVHKPEAKEAFFKARDAALRSTTPQENEVMWQYLQKHKPYAVNLVLNEERLRYMQQLNIELGVQKTVLPFAQVADMSIARDAVALLGGEA